MRRVTTTVLLALAGLLPLSTPAHADEVVVVPGTSFPSGDTYLSWFGCDDLFTPAVGGPRATIGLEEAAPLGARATRLALAGGGTASGPVGRVGSVADATWSWWVRPVSGGQGVAHVWYVSSELEDGEVWVGRADLGATAGSWQQVEPAAATFTWTRHVAATGESLGSEGAATVDAFTAEHGDGPGYLLSGFGCDGAGFAVDAISVGDPGSVTTYDLEGVPVTTTIGASADRVAEGAEVVLTGSTIDSGQRATGAPLRLEARPEGAADFAPVREVDPAGPDGRVVATVSPGRTTAYRWFMPATGYADATWSPAVEVRVTRQGD
ncbi:hypothetical protein [Nocardioides euryhalodurans]|uniref:Uncharacterized protein n=1 Tax=Nocardioides euryhalodurans TaxID=2518370 RepID=A0A4P7GHX0_9ACTN|nr:hypothetical protein [Nocardioides euryhalodurans]QBR91331.1 hypothetical protein EXE57_02885 [Nocardioides euryhalodurans]